MSQPWNGAAPLSTGTAPKDAAGQSKPLASQNTGIHPSVATRGDLLRQLSTEVLGCGHLLGAIDRLESAAREAGRLIAAGQLDRTSAATVLSIAAQAAGVGQTDALALIRETFQRAGVR